MRKNEVERHYTILGSVQVTEEMFSWFNLLTKNEEQRVSEFAMLNDECRTTPSAIIHYRRQMLKKQPQDLKITSDKPEEIAKQLEEIFLEPIDAGYVVVIKKTMERTGWTWNDVIQKHYEDIEKKIWRIVSCKNKVHSMMQ